MFQNVVSEHSKGCNIRLVVGDLMLSAVVIAALITINYTAELYLNGASDSEQIAHASVLQDWSDEY